MAKTSPENNKENVFNTYSSKPHVKVNVEALIEVYNTTLRKYNLDPTGDNFIAIGNGCKSQQDVNNYISHVIPKIFENINLEIDQYINDKRNDINNELSSIESEIEMCNSFLDATNDSGYIYIVNSRIEAAKQSEEELESIAFPEKKLQKAVDKTYIEFEKEFATIAGSDTTDASALTSILKQKRIFNSTHGYFLEIKSLWDSFKFKIHSTYYPPKVLYYRMFYIISALLLIAEIGFSCSMVKNIMNMSGHVSDVIFSSIYAIGISLALAIMFRHLIDTLLFQKDRVYMITFWVVYIAIFFIQYNLFSMNEVVGNGNALINKKALVLSFFSSLFSLSNAFMFREASFLHHLHTHVFKHGDAKSLTDEKNQLLDKWNDKIRALNNNKNTLNRLLVNITDRDITAVKNMIENLKSISIEKTKIGFSSRNQIN